MIKINIVNLARRKPLRFPIKIVKKNVFLLLKLLKINNGELNIYLTTPAQMLRINKKCRGKNKTSAVLSFPESKDFINPPHLTPFGEIFICPSQIKKDAKKLKIPFLEYLGYLVVHGILHLKGYDHDTSDKEKTMQKKEEWLLNKMNSVNRS